jgi:hypothetical protein
MLRGLGDRNAGAGDQRAGEKRNKVATAQILSLVPIGRKD